MSSQTVSISFPLSPALNLFSFHLFTFAGFTPPSHPSLAILRWKSLKPKVLFSNQTIQIVLGEEENGRARAFVPL